jgi:hypothetical protein
VNRRAAKERRVADALHNSRWITNIIGSLSITALQQYVTLWSRLLGVALNNVKEKFLWRWTANQQYSAASAYRAFFVGQCGIPAAKEFSKTKAPPSPNSSYGLHCSSCRSCALCAQDDEEISHLLLGCVYAREVSHCLQRPSTLSTSPLIATPACRTGDARRGNRSRRRHGRNSTPWSPSLAGDCGRSATVESSTTPWRRQLNYPAGLWKRAGGGSRRGTEAWLSSCINQRCECVVLAKPV